MERRHGRTTSLTKNPAFGRPKPCAAAEPTQDAHVSNDLVIDVDGREVHCAKGTTLLNALVNAGVLIGTACGGRGVCHFCRVTVRGASTPVQPEEMRALGNVLVQSGMRLACRVVVEAPLAVSVPPIRGKGKA